jgi:hypothetical protein
MRKGGRTSRRIAEYAANTAGIKPSCQTRGGFSVHAKTGNDLQSASASESCACFRADDAAAALDHPHLGTRSPFNGGDAGILSLDQGTS